VQIRDGPAAVTGNICFFVKGHCENGKAGKDRFNAGSQKTSQVTIIVKSDGKRFCKIYLLQNLFLVLQREIIARIL
jgi:hypothetical protein